MMIRKTARIPSEFAMFANVTSLLSGNAFISDTDDFYSRISPHVIILGVLSSFQAISACRSAFH